MKLASIAEMQPILCKDTMKTGETIILQVKYFKTKRDDAIGLIDREFAET